ncbi:winged helix-turn-helix transcriptional regulator [Streptomyces sp. HNM0575]|uniref:ArsR/SmtB family transcription factor n=1 Tax=Streptomyces sp. HNM0575 TaxID=2716338 RepID=UPI00145F831B|nr:winged helix-turn-helix domain-containing protein [Streptomyces sp. HNM0575]NLU71760.1 winged helix-turn-helix transcriptional regulator [Streptomyces sp. HNM0575]
MTLRIHFTLTDLARVRFAGPSSPLATTAFSTVRLAHCPGPPQLDLWRRAVRPRLACGPTPFSELLPTAPDHPLPGFLRPWRGLHTLDEELERLRATPRHVLRADLDYLATRRDLPRWTHRLADGDRGAVTGLAESVRDYHRAAVAPYWPGLAAVLAADLASRTRQLRDGGIEAVLGTLHPRMRWRPPVLEIEVPGGESDYHLGGRGLLLAPTAFASYLPCDPDDEQPTLYYEVTRNPLPRTRVSGPQSGLAALLGHSRAAVLQVIAEGVSTGELARRTGLSPASASEHTTVLRGVGLVRTERRGRGSHHSLTPLGAELLLESSPPSGGTGDRGGTARAAAPRPATRPPVPRRGSA